MAKDKQESRNVVAIIQARIGSRRFPGKVLADLGGRPVLEWVVEAVRQADGVNQVVVGTTTNPEDRVIEEWCDEKGVSCFRGEPLDVLKRYSDCARKYNATHVLRITADCPMLDTQTVSSVLNQGLADKADYFGLAGAFPDGYDCEGFTIEALDRANREAINQLDREHVTNFFKENPEAFLISRVFLFEGYEDVRLTVDYPADLDFLNLLLSRAKEFDADGVDLLGVYLSIQSRGEDVRSFSRNDGFIRTGWTTDSERSYRAC